VRILGIGARIDLGDLYRTLLREGHEVRVHASDPEFAATFDGLVERVPSWRDALTWVGADGLVLFEKVGQGAVQDALRAEGYQVIGGSALGDRLEYDRGFGQQALRDAGLQTAPALDFQDAAAAAAWLRAHPGRTVLKHFNNARATFVGDHETGADVLYQLARAPAGPVLLMPRIVGIEVGVGAYFDGKRFLDPACIDFEHKRFFPGEIGEMTGEMGTLVSYRGAGPIMRATLKRMEPMFEAARHVGYVNLNMIVNEDGIWPLEFTCRFGNPGFAILAPLQAAGWGDLFQRMLRGGAVDFPTFPGWCTGIVLTIPPFPEERPGAPREADPPVLFHVPMDDPQHYHFSDMRIEDGQLFAGRRTGYVMVVTGAGESIEESQVAALARAHTVCLPDLRYRSDIGERVRLGQAEQLRRLGWMDDAPPDGA
jgi:phosphoribosylamine--glycine ligase